MANQPLSGDYQNLASSVNEMTLSSFFMMGTALNGKNLLADGSIFFL